PMMLVNRSLVFTSAATRVSAGQYVGLSSAPAAGMCAIIIAQILASRTAKDGRNILATRSSLAGRGSEFVEMHVAIRLRPQTNLPGHRCRQRVLKVELAIEIALDLIARDADFEVVPLPGRGRRVSDPFDRRPPAFLELPKDQIVFQAVRPDRQI